MRTFLVALSLLAFATTPRAAEAPLTIPKDAPYPQVRRQLFRMGIEPVVVKPRAGQLAPCPHDTLFCQMYKEVLACGVGGGMQYCQFLFRRRSDAAMLVVLTAGQADTTVVPADFNGILVQGIARAEPHHLADVVIATDDRAGRR